MNNLIAPFPKKEVTLAMAMLAITLLIETFANIKSSRL